MRVASRPTNLKGAKSSQLLCCLCVLFWLVRCESNVDQEEDWSAVTWGSVVKLVHQSTGYRLHSHEIAYGTGSGQQSVTAYPFGGDSNSYWIVKGPSNDTLFSQGTLVDCGSFIRLEHLNTRKNLHSHLPKSPISGNLEVSAFGVDGEGDSGDVFQLICAETKAQYWKRSQAVYLKHVDTKAFLSTSQKYVYPEPIEGHLEVFGSKKKSTTDSLWLTDDGFYFMKP